MEIKILSSLAKVFPDEICGDYEIKSLSCFKNERVSFQAAVKSDRDERVSVKLSCGSEGVSVYLVKNIPSAYAAPPEGERDGYYLKNGRPGEYPDLLVPYSNGAEVKAREYTAFWFEFDPCGLSEPKHNIEIEITGSERKKACVEIEILDKELPQTLTCVNWFHSDCLAQYYNTEVFSEEYWRIVESFMETAVRHGVNTILTPIFTPPLDTEVGGERLTVQLVDVTKQGKEYIFGFDNLKKWIETAERAGMKYFEMSHLFTQWGAKHAPKIMAHTDKGFERIFGWETDAAGVEYTDFLRQLAPRLIDCINSLGVHDRCIFHTSDEPSEEDSITYTNAAKIIRELFGEFKITDALSDFMYYENGAVSSPVPCTDKIEEFAFKVPDLWTYYCCVQTKGNRPNRFFSMPSLRNRILGFLMYKYNLTGFLHWGYNFYNTQYSKRAVDPFTETDAGGAFPSGDSFVVYPAPDGTAYASLRLKVFYEAVEDYEALRLAESIIGRDKTLELLEEGLDKPLAMGDYPHSEEWLLNKREQINRAVME
ncbi:MAG: DUF4091 domain-containing protein [Clostridiales bacterium]|nr:DUF4091 domain-containing protein [Clostridiales bacterium]